jgi:hypothetical protein
MRFKAGDFTEGLTFFAAPTPTSFLIDSSNLGSLCISYPMMGAVMQLAREKE